MFCESCGKQIEPSASYCASCGSRVITPAPVVNPQFRQAVPYPIPQQVQPQRKMSVGKIVLVVAIIAIVITGLGVVAFLNGRNPNSENSSNSGNNSKQNPANSRNFTVWKGYDAREGNRFAFAMLIPKGWTAQGGVQRYYYPFGGADFNLTAKDPTGKMSVFFALNDFPNFIEPSSSGISLMQCASADLSTFVQCGENTWWLPANYIGLVAFVHSYVTAAQYLQLYSSNQMGFVYRMAEHPSLMAIVNTVHPDVSLVKTVDNPYLKNRVVDVTANEWSGADGLFTYTDHGVAYKVLVQMLLGRMSVSFSGFQFSSWYSSYWGYSAPESDFNATGQIYSIITPTVRVDKQWLQDEIQRSAQASQLIAQHVQNMMNLQYSLISSLQESQEKTGQGWIDALGGTENAYNPNDPSAIYKVSIDYPHWYDCGTYLIGTSISNFQTTCSSLTIGNPPGY